MLKHPLSSYSIARLNIYAVVTNCTWFCLSMSPLLQASTLKWRILQSYYVDYIYSKLFKNFSMSFWHLLGIVWTVTGHIKSQYITDTAVCIKISMKQRQFLWSYKSLEETDLNVNFSNSDAKAKRMLICLVANVKYMLKIIQYCGKTYNTY